MANFDPENPAPAGAGIFGFNVAEEEAKVILVAVPYEATTSYRTGTKDAPELIRRASHQLDFCDPRIGKPYESGIFMLSAPEKLHRINSAACAAAAHARSLDATDARREIAVTEVDRASEAINQYTYNTAKAQLTQNKIVGVVGGDHSVPFGAIRAHAEHYGELGILQLDAHADLRVAYEGFRFSHASIMDRVLAEIPDVKRIVQIGVRDFSASELKAIETQPDRIQTYFDADLARARLSGQLLSTFQDVIEQLPQHVYLSFDIDGLDPKLCPGTGTPVPGGLDLNEVLLLLECLVETGKTILGFDLCEVASQTPGDDWDGNVGARLLYALIGWTLKSRSTIS